jgi:hypothetical protein
VYVNFVTQKALGINEIGYLKNMHSKENNKNLPEFEFL